MLNIAVCDDSIEFQKVFNHAVKKCLEEIFPLSLSYKLLNGFSSSEQVLLYLEDNTIDILFLDIDMPKISGLELAKRLVWKNAETVIVFVSGYDHFVYEVFEFSPFAFLRKDHILEELPKTISRIAEKFEKRNTDVELATVDGKCVVCARNILYIKSKGNYYYCCDKAGKEIACRGTLSDAEKLFEKYDFYRVHSAFIINMSYIQKIEKNDLYLGMEDIKIPIAQRRLSGFRKKYAEYTMRSFHL